MKVVIAKSAGFCFGVRRAVESVERELDKGETICTLGELMHNRQAVEALEKRGAHPVDTPEEADTPKVAIRSHGVTPDVLEELKSLGHEVLDLTCPFVARIHELVRNYSNEYGAPVIVVGKRTHPEVIGTCGWCRQSYVVADETEAAALPEMQRALLVAQTTCESERFERVRALLETRIPDLTSRNTVCSTSRERQREAMELASRADMMIVVGGKGSAKLMFSKLFRPAAVSFGTCSSVATIPTNMEVAEESGISKDVSDIVLPMGATMHMDGSAMSAIIKVAFLFSVFGMDFSTDKAILAIIVAVFSSVAMSGIPGGGGTGELVVCTIFFPDQLTIAYPIALAIGNLVDPPATMVNAAGDYVVSFIVSRYVDGKDWLQKRLHGKSTNND